MISGVFNRERFWKQFGFNGLEPDEYKKRTTAVQLGFFAAVGGVLYTLLYSYLGFPYLTVATVAYVALFIINLVLLYATKNYHFFNTSQLLGITVLPVAAQVLVGGFINGSAVALASFLSPAGALLFAPRSTARRYFYAFVFLIVAVGTYEYFYTNSAVVLPRHVIIIFFTSNIISTFAIIYFILENFLKKLEDTRKELEQSLVHLKATQAQLIHTEKMASLGELTAGIAHEIQNPLNFVNNFSEVSTELLDEMEEALRKNETEEAMLISADVKGNLEKIIFHGKRADAIVKGMLQHSRTSTGKKEPTDINVLAEEYLRLSYLGLRAKDKEFNTDCKTDFDESIGKIELVPQDIGRVLLNLYNNAFYAASTSSKGGVAGTATITNPTVWVSTKKEGNKIVIKVRDNGKGIPEQIVDKIFQPFFTTKPTGQGTGLGLSLSYDIIKAHGGELKVETKEGEGAEFIIKLPGN